MRPDLAPFVGPLLGLLGSGLQWLRQYQGIKDRWAYILAFVMAMSAYLLCLDYSKIGDWQSTILFGALWVGGNIAAVLGGTFAASGLAKAGVAAVPMTNSK